jgi:hypothetical protein
MGTAITRTHSIGWCSRACRIALAVHGPIAVRLRARGALIVQVCGGQGKWRRATQAHCEQQRARFLCFHGETPSLVVHPVFGLLFTEGCPQSDGRF